MCLELFILGLRVLWPVILVHICVNIVITYISVRSAVPPSARAELWQFIKTRQSPSATIKGYAKGAMWRVIGYAIAWELLSVVVSRELFWTQTSRQARSNDFSLYSDSHAQILC